MTASKFCESCRNQPVARKVTEESHEDPYRLCDPCARRLHARALRPLEWFNLAALHGATHLLGSSFYDSEGNAGAPEEKVVGAGRLPAPTLAEASRDLERLIDFAIARWIDFRSSKEGFSRFDPAQVMKALMRRVQSRKSPAVHDAIYEIAGRCAPSAAADWVRDRWKHANDQTFSSLVRAAAKCLPPEEALERCLAYVRPLMGREQLDAVRGLRPLRNPKVADWMETRLTDPSEPLNDGWGREAAYSGMTWDRARRWLLSGRPLSLVALDSLVACVDVRLATLFDDPRPQLLDPAPVREMSRTLDDYLKKDPSPRVEERIGWIKEGWAPNNPK